VFTSLHRRGRDAYCVGDWAGAADQLSGALRLWRGEPLADVAPGIFRDAQAQRLAELRLEALEWRIHADLQLGRSEEVIAELGELIAAYPLRERFHGLLMLAGYRAGRQAEALSAYRRARSVLVREVGGRTRA
jgi:DNA-binding SARP family transcriptional activator